jgi:hypothetical protein
MPDKQQASIRKNRPGRWRGYIGGVRVIQFEDSATESAEEGAKRWLATPSRPRKEEPAAAPAPQFVEHVKINCDDVVRHGLQQDPRFLKLYWNMQRDLGDRNYGREVCLHEAGHAVLMEQDAMTNVRFAGPDIIYDLVKRDFVGSSARAIADDQPNAVVDDDFVFKITSHMAAGGVTLRKLGNIDGHVGDDGDLADLRTIRGTTVHRDLAKTISLPHRGLLHFSGSCPRTNQTLNSKIDFADSCPLVTPRTWNSTKLLQHCRSPNSARP